MKKRNIQNKHTQPVLGNIFLLITLLFVLLGCKIGIDKRLVARDVIRKTKQQYIIIRV